eukprot:2281240-Rhodomonas_salina.5
MHTLQHSLIAGSPPKTWSTGVPVLRDTFKKSSARVQHQAPPKPTLKIESCTRTKNTRLRMTGRGIFLPVWFGARKTPMPADMAVTAVSSEKSRDGAWTLCRTRPSLARPGCKLCAGRLPAYNLLKRSIRYCLAPTANLVLPLLLAPAHFVPGDSPLPLSATRRCTAILYR